MTGSICAGVYQFRHFGLYFSKSLPDMEQVVEIFPRKSASGLRPSATFQRTFFSKKYQLETKSNRFESLSDAVGKTTPLTLDETSYFSSIFLYSVKTRSSASKSLIFLSDSSFLPASLVAANSLAKASISALASSAKFWPTPERVCAL